MEGQEHIVGRAILEGNLVLLSPLLIGDGSGAHEARESDISVLRNAKGEPFIPGTSLTGALRAKMEESIPKEKSALLFGNLTTIQSSVQVADIIFPANTIITERNGVAIDGILGTAKENARYDYEAIERLSKAKLKIEFAFRGIHTNDPTHWQTSSISAEVLGLVGKLCQLLEAGISLGANTSKGFGRVKLEKAELGLYDFCNQDAVKKWLLIENPAAVDAPEQLDHNGKIEYNPADFYVEALFALRSSLLIRKYQLDDQNREIAAMLKSGENAVIPGTTIKGVLRHRAEQITRLEEYLPAWLENLMGSGQRDMHREKRGKSRFIVEESYLKLGKELQERSISRNRIDRFTGGTIRNALFTTKPVYQQDDGTPTVMLRFHIKDASKAEAGLALFLLKDLYQGKIAFGGETGVGRGTLRGMNAEINYLGNEFTLDKDGKVISGQRQLLEEYAQAFVKRSV